MGFLFLVKHFKQIASFAKETSGEIAADSFGATENEWQEEANRPLRRQKSEKAMHGPSWPLQPALVAQGRGKPHAVRVSREALFLLRRISPRT